MKNKKLVAIVLALVMVLTLGLTACQDECDKNGHTWSNGVCTVCGETCTHTYANGVCTICGNAEPAHVHSYGVDGKCSCGQVDPTAVFTYNTYTAVSPSNWNELTYQDNNDTQIMNYLGINFFGYDFKYDADGEIIDGDYVVTYEGATKLEDVTQGEIEIDEDTIIDIADKYGFDEDDVGYAYKITLREDLKWENGMPITVADYLYSMAEQLNPDFQNYRADSFYVGSSSIVGAKEYALQGQSGWFAADTPYSVYDATTLDSILVFTLGPKSENTKAAVSFRGSMGFPDSYQAANVAAYLKAYYIPTLDTNVVASMEGKTLTEIKADTAMAAEWNKIIGWWQTDPNEELDFFVVDYTYPEVEFEDVAFFQGETEFELVFVLVNPIVLLKEDGSLSYKAAYNMASYPLVYEPVYEVCKQEPAAGSELWTSTYNTSVETTMSCGPYKLTNFQAGKQYILERNEYWYGYNKTENEGLYQTDRIVCETIAQYATAFLKFRQGGIDGIGIDVSVATDYKGSSQAYYTPDDYVNSLQLQCDKESLEARETVADVNKTMLTYVEFRQALSLALDRDAYNRNCTTAYQSGYGLFGPMHYYDVENGGVYRDTTPAKQTLCDVYAINVSDYANLDAAADAITGYNLTTARQLLEAAYTKAVADGEIDSNDVVTLTFGTSVDNATVRRRYEFLKTAWETLAVGTSLEGRLTCDFDASFGTTWADAFREGDYDVCMGGWSGAAWDPGYFLLAYLDPSYMYSASWDTSSYEMTFTVVGGDPDDDNDDGSFDVTATMSLLDWYDCLNGASSATYNWATGSVPESVRLTLIAALEEEILTQYYTLPISYSYDASLIGYQIDYVTYTYNTFLGYGGIKYMSYNYTDANWTTFVAENDGQLDYTK